MSALNDLLAEFLNKLEQAESRLLSWGMVDGSFSDDEVVDLADEFLDSQESDSEVSDGDELVDTCLLYTSPSPRDRG